MLLVTNGPRSGGIRHEARMFALENKVADSHKQISNQIAELARMLEHVYFGPPQTNLNYKKTS